MKYQIVGKFGSNPWECIDTTDTIKDAYSLIHEYRIAFGTAFELKILKVRD